MNMYIQQITQQDNTTNIHVTMYLHPIIYANSKFLDSITEPIAGAGDVGDDEKYHTTTNLGRTINGPISNYGEELEPPILDEWNGFVDDCKWLIEEVGFTIIKSERSTDSKKSEYVLMFGLDDTPCGTLVYDLRISDHPFDATFPEEYKDIALEYLTMENILDGSATKAGIDFQVKKVTVGTATNDSWDRAFNRLYNKLTQLRRKVRIRIKTRNQSNK